MKINLLGNLSTPVTAGQAGTYAKATFTVKERKTRPQENAKSNFWNVTILGKRAEFAANYLKEGSAVFVTGTADWNEFTGQDGTPRKVLSITADSVDFVPKDFSNQNQQSQPQQMQPQMQQAPVVQPQPMAPQNDDELLF